MLSSSWWHVGDVGYRLKILMTEFEQNRSTPKCRYDPISTFTTKIDSKIHNGSYRGWYEFLSYWQSRFNRAGCLFGNLVRISIEFGINAIKAFDIIWQVKLCGMNLMVQYRWMPSFNLVESMLFRSPIWIRDSRIGPVKILKKDVSKVVLHVC